MSDTELIIEKQRLVVRKRHWFVPDIAPLKAHWVADEEIILTNENAEKMFKSLAKALEI